MRPEPVLLLALTAAAPLAAAEPTEATAALTANAIVFDKDPSPDGKLAFTIENIFSQTLTLKRIRLLRVSRQVDSRRTALAQTFEIKPDSAACKLPVTIEPGADCRFNLDLSSLSGPGRYEALIRVQAAAGEPQAIQLVSERSSPWYGALLLVLAGTGAGAIVGWWRGGASKKAQDLITVRQISDSIARSINGTNADFIGKANGLQSQADELARNIAEGKAYTEAQIEQLRIRAGYLDTILSSGTDNRKVTAAIQLLSESPLDNALDSAALRNMLHGENAESGALLPPKLPIDHRTPLATLTGWSQLLNAATGLVLVTVFASIAFTTVYDSATWGSPRDLLDAFLIGFAAWAGTATGTSALLAAARTK
jgi:hypothetical protein